MSVTSPKGFLASGVASGVKASGDLDLALIASASGPICAAAVFTTNGAAAAPVQVSRQHLVQSRGQIGAIVLNSGCANAATGERGHFAASHMCRVAARALSLRPEQVLVCSTGLIGTELPLDRVVAAIPVLVKALGPSVADGLLAARAIMTTDTHPKQVLVEREGFSVGGMVKGAGMIAPNMATMLCVLTTDAAASPEELASALRVAVGESFNELIVDGCTSTNDTVIVLASGVRGAVPHGELVSALASACRDLARQLAEDAEGTTKVVDIVVEGAKSVEDARLAARRVANSLLVKTSLYGGDPYWGRVASELGASGAAFDMAKVRIAYGGVVVCDGGVEVPHDRERVATHMAGSQIEITCDLRIGPFRASVLTTDLGHAYIDENMRTS